MKGSYFQQAMVHTNQPVEPEDQETRSIEQLELEQLEILADIIVSVILR